jgi:hypothetical protein
MPQFVLENRRVFFKKEIGVDAPIHYTIFVSECFVFISVFGGEIKGYLGGFLIAFFFVFILELHFL